MSHFIVRNYAHALLKRLMTRSKTYQAHSHQIHDRLESFFEFCKLMFLGTITYQLLMRFLDLVPGMMEANTWEILGGYFDEVQRMPTTPPVLTPYSGDARVLFVYFVGIFGILAY